MPQLTKILDGRMNPIRSPAVYNVRRELTPIPVFAIFEYIRIESQMCAFPYWGNLDRNHTCEFPLLRIVPTSENNDLMKKTFCVLFTLSIRN